MLEKHQELLNTFIQTAKEGEAPGCYLDVPDEVYHHPSFPGISGSKLHEINDNIYTYIYNLTHPKEETKSLAYGRAFHAAILTPDIFKRDYVVAPKFDRRTTKGKADEILFLEENKGKIAIDQGDYEDIKGMMEECYSTPKVVELLKGGHKEFTMIWNTSDVLCKGKLDLIREEELIIADFKTTESCKEAHVQKDLLKWYYAAKAAFYIDGAKETMGKDFDFFVYVFIEKKPPYNLDLFYLDQDTIDTGRRIYMSDLQKYIDYTKAEDKRIFKPRNFKPIGLAPWAHKLY